MFIPFLAAFAVAMAFTQLGAMAVKISVLTVALNAMIALCIALAALSAWLLRKALPNWLRHILSAMFRRDLCAYTLRVFHRWLDKKRLRPNCQLQQITSLDQ